MSCEKAYYMTHKTTLKQKIPLLNVLLVFVNKPYQSF